MTGGGGRRLDGTRVPSSGEAAGKLYLDELSERISNVSGGVLRIDARSARALLRWATARLYVRVRDLEPLDRFVDARGIAWLFHGGRRAQPYKDGLPMAGVMVSLPGEALVVRIGRAGERRRR